MKKVGIVTFSNTVDNYGQVLQYLATQEYLTSLGFYATLLISDWHREKIRECAWLMRKWRWVRSLAVRAKKYVCAKKCVHADVEVSVKETKVFHDSIEDRKNAEFKRWHDSSIRNEGLHPRYFNDFKNRYFHTFKGTYEDIIEHGFEYFCVGSDQTWSGPGGYYLFDWVPDCCKRFTIAPSVGHWRFKEEQLAEYRQNLPKFSFVTVREENGLELCRQCGRNDAKLVLDPTFLLSAEEYDRFAEPVNSDKPYALIYMLGGEIAIDIGEIFEFCKKQGLEVKYVASQGREDEFPKCYATVGEWLGLMRGATYVFTNSFHGMAFSIIYRKPFLVFPLTGIMSDMNGRVCELGRKMCLMDRVYSGDLGLVQNSIDWSRLEMMVDANTTMLQSMIGAIDNSVSKR